MCGGGQICANEFTERQSITNGSLYVPFRCPIIAKKTDDAQEILFYVVRTENILAQSHSILLLEYGFQLSILF